DRSFFENPVLLNAVNHAKENQSALHLFGLLSDGGVHSHINHLYALLELAKTNGLDKVYVHGFLDGRDVGPKTALTYIETAEEKMKAIGVGQFATISGRYYAMDRDNRWERVKLAYDAINDGLGPRFSSAQALVEAAYESDVTDEFVIPGVIVDANNQAIGPVQDNDAIVFFNFRPDRAIQLSKCFANASFDEIERNHKANLNFVQMTPYSEDVAGSVVFPSEDLKNTVGEVLAAHGKKQLR